MSRYLLEPRCLRLGLYLLVAALTVGTLHSQPAVTKAIVGGTLVNSDGSPPLRDAVVVMSGDRIVAVGSPDEIQIEPNAERIDATGKWIIPGLVDAHVHFFQSGGLYARPDIIDLRARVPYATETSATRARLAETFARYLSVGITSVADVGGPMWNFEVRSLATQADIAPRVSVAGPLIAPVQPDQFGSDDPPILRAGSPQEARNLVRIQAERRPDFVKIWYVVDQAGHEPYLPTVRAAIEESHALGIPVAVHATELETARAAVLAGADLLVHGVEDREVDAEFIRLLRENDVVYTPTLAVYEGYEKTFARDVRLTEADLAIGDPFVADSLFALRAIPDAELPPPFRSFDERPAFPPNTFMLRNLRLVHDGGVTVAVGTDAGNIGTLHASSMQRELELMVDAGLTPYEVLRAATAGGARALGRETEIGSVTPGMLADLVILGSDPLLDVRKALDVHRVVKGGAVLSPDEILPTTPEQLVQRQVNAYNARDIDAFAATYAADVELFLHPNQLISAGRDALRRDYAELFAGAPNLHAEISAHMAIGQHVIAREHVTGLPDGATIDAVVIYRVRAGLIDAVWFVLEE